MKSEYVIPATNLQPLIERLEKLQKRATKLGVPPISWTHCQSHTESEYIPFRGKERYWVKDDGSPPLDPRDKPTGRKREWLKLTVEGASPSYEGWTFIGTLSPIPLDDGSSENEVRAVPGHKVPPEYRDRVGQCDHCQMKRRRTETFVLQHEDGSHKMVGRQCLKDFLGHANPHELASWAEMLGAFETLAQNASNEDYEGFGGSEENLYCLERFLAVTSACIRQDGWLSKTAAYQQGKEGQATANHVEMWFRPISKFMSRYEQEKMVRWKQDREPTEDDEKRALEAIEWAKSLEDLEQDYFYNLNLLARAGIVRRQSSGLAASMIPAWDKEVERRKRDEKRPSVHVGKERQRMEMTVTVIKIVQCESYAYGVTGLHVMTDSGGNDIVWFASGSAQWLEVGGTYEVKATVKSHKDFKGRPQTVVNRVTMIQKL